MEERKLTKADIDKVRHIEGFPIGKDEDIIALSRPPYYTACPNPFIEDFIRENGTPYDEATDNYHREPFAADVSEGKNDPLYMAHGYHTKVPFKAIMRYILHYTEPGDIVLDGFCGSGMTGVAAQMCGCPDNATKHQLEQEMADSNIQWGYRYAILNDLSPAATFISSNYVMPQSASTFIERAHSIIEECVKECSWMYETVHVDECGKPIYGLTENLLWAALIIQCGLTCLFVQAVPGRSFSTMLPLTTQMGLCVMNFIALTATAYFLKEIAFVRRKQNTMICLVKQ